TEPDGPQSALSDDLCICLRTPHPRLVPSQKTS
ncbi:PAAR domain-containing protein, partial [Paraburkholderia fungorum]